METNILTLCDFAKDYNGQLTIAGTFNRVHSSIFPTAPISFNLVCQFILKENIVGDHYITITIKNKETDELLIEKQELRLNVEAKKDNLYEEHMVSSLILNFNNIVFQNPSTYVIEVLMDGNLEWIEFYVLQG